MCEVNWSRVMVESLTLNPFSQITSPWTEDDLSWDTVKYDPEPSGQLKIKQHRLGGTEVTVSNRVTRLQNIYLIKSTLGFVAYEVKKTVLGNMVTKIFKPNRQQILLFQLVNLSIYSTVIH